MTCLPIGIILLVYNLSYGIDHSCFENKAAIRKLMIMESQKKWQIGFLPKKCVLLFTQFRCYYRHVNCSYAHKNVYNT